MEAQLDQRFARLESAEKLLTAFSYKDVLKRGYALVRDDAGQPLRSAAAIANGMKLDIEMSDGNVKAVAGETVAAPQPRPFIRRRRSRPTSAEGQGSLF
jgi:exodeoxyribonuclease VII large subunit